jgi:hypothetical protein
MATHGGAWGKPRGKFRHLAGPHFPMHDSTDCQIPPHRQNSLARTITIRSSLAFMQHPNTECHEAVGVVAAATTAPTRTNEIHTL